MQFEVKGRVYFLNYVAAQGWVLFTPTPEGVRAMRVIDDDAIIFNQVIDLGEQDEMSAN